MRAIGSAGLRAASPGPSRECTGTSRDPLTRRRTGARPARAGRPDAAAIESAGSSSGLSRRRAGISQEQIANQHERNNLLDMTRRGALRSAW